MKDAMEVPFNPCIKATYESICDVSILRPPRPCRESAVAYLTPQ